jgi:predicted phosphodiesterase
MRGSYLCALGLTGLVLSGAGTVNREVTTPPAVKQPVAARTDTSAPVITHGPYLQLPSATSMTVVWHTDRVAVSRVEFGRGDRFDRVAISSRHGLIDNDRTSHIIRLNSLEPGTTYRYRVVSKTFLGYERQHIVAWGDSVVSEPFEFTTLDPEKDVFSFVMVSDIHERAEELAGMIRSEAWRDIDLAVFNGDMIDDFMRPDQVFTGFLDVAVEGFATGMPFVFARGNHETRGRYARSTWDFLPLDGGRSFYSFDHGPVHFIVLDTGEDKEDSHEYYNGLVDFDRFLEEQAVWLDEDLRSEAARKARFRVLISHIPPRGSDAYWARRVQQYFEAPVLGAGIDLWLSGHTHRLSRIDPAPGENDYTLLIGPTHAVTRVEVSPDELRVTVTNIEGVVLDAFTVHR